jgi:hypothetical protein
LLPELMAPGWRACVVGVRRARPLVPVTVLRLAGPVLLAAFSTQLPPVLLSWLRAGAPLLGLRVGALTAAALDGLPAGRGC